jgi:hypothetical protein
MKRVISLFVICMMFVLLVGSVYAIGSSTRNVDSNSDVSLDSNDAVIDVSGACGDFEDRLDRIKCRLKVAKEGGSKVRDVYEEYKTDSLPEACSKLKDEVLNKGNELSKDECRKFYNKIQNCYDKTGNDKFSCFRRSAGLTTASLSGQGSKKLEMRQYVVELLYDLQEKIEKAVEDERISEEDGARLIEQIVVIKENILGGASKAEVKPLIESFKKDFRSVRSSIE